MSNPDRLSGLDAAFLHLERGGAHMHVASVITFEGEPPAYAELVEAIEERLHLVPRYRQKLAFVPLGQGRPVWVDDPHFNLRYHVGHGALPAPGSDAQLATLAGRIFATPLDRHKPLWEVSLVEGLQPAPDGTPRFAIIAKTHHALVDGISGVDMTSVLFSTTPEPMPAPTPALPWVPRPEPSSSQLLARALLDRSVDPAEVAGVVGRLLRAPLRAVTHTGGRLAAVGAVARAGASPAPASILNVPIGPHRRYGWVNASLDVLREVKDRLGGTLNDAVLTTVALGLGRWMRGRGEDTHGLVLKVMIPVSVRAGADHGALGNQISAVWAPLPVDEDDPRAAFAFVHEAMGDLKRSGQAVGAEVLTGLTDFAPPTIASQAARLQARQRMFNLVVTNVPGPQRPLYLLGRRMTAIHPVAPLAENQALCVAVMSYDGRLCFGLLADYDALPDLGRLVEEIEGAMFDLARSAQTARRPWVMEPRHATTSAHTPDGRPTARA